MSIEYGLLGFIDVFSTSFFFFMMPCIWTPWFRRLIIFFIYYREDFHYDNGNKTGKAVLRGASGATRDGTKKNGNWHGPATFTSQDGEVKDERWDNGRKL